jgi:hypothetical protein
MNKRTLMTAGFTALLFGATGSMLCAQDSSQVAYSSETADKAAPAAAKKPHKVWTEDDVASVRTPADTYVDQQQAAADTAATAAAQQEKAAQTEKHKGTPFALTNPKSLAEADKMIAWEENDLNAQQEYVEKVRKQVAEAGPEDRDRLEKYLAKRIAIVEEIKLERANLQKQKKELEKKAAAGANAPADTPPAQ